MRVVKGHKILLDVTPEIDSIFVSWCGVARWAYNYGLERKIKSYEADGRSPSAYSLMKEVVALKKTEERAWLNGIPCSVARMALLHLDRAYKEFFRKVKEGKAKKGFPKFKSKKTAKMAFHIEPKQMAVNGCSVRIPRVGWVKMHQPIRFNGRLVWSVCVSKRAGKWYISFNVETEIADVIESQEKSAVGIDVGVKHLATLSNGKKFENPKALYRLAGLLTRAQRQMARKKVGSNRREKAKLRVQRIYKRIADLRANATHNVSSYVSNNYTGAAIESLNVLGMVKNHNLAKAISDANFSSLHRQLEYKMDWAGGEARKADRFFPSSKTCSTCGLVNNKLTLKDREWDCECGAHHDRDVNAAINLLNECYGRGLTATARGGQERLVSPVKRELRKKVGHGNVASYREE